MPLVLRRLFSIHFVASSSVEVHPSLSTEFSPIESTTAAPRLGTASRCSLLLKTCLEDLIKANGN
jgi:hypothetical protein